jgi:hypothetical protein
MCCCDGGGLNRPSSICERELARGNILKEYAHVQAATATHNQSDRRPLLLRDETRTVYLAGSGSLGRSVFVPAASAFQGKKYK